MKHPVLPSVTKTLSGYKLMLMLIMTLTTSATLNVNAQYVNIVIDSTSGPNETAIFIDPSNPLQLLGGANLNSTYTSSDGGYTWERKAMSSQYNVWGDPCVVIDTLGYYYYFHLSWPTSGAFIDRIVCQRSIDKGATWNTGFGIGFDGQKAQDKEWAVVNPYNNDIYVTWTQFDVYGTSNPADSSIIRFSKSTDRGINWSEPVRLSEKAGDCVDDDNTVEGAVPCVGPNGEIYVSWAGPLGIVFDRSTDRGETWLDHDIFVTDFPGGWNYDIPGISRCNGLPVTCCDLSNGPNRGTIYINWTDQRNGPDDTDVWLVKSTDGGSTWSVPVRVNDDLPGKQQFFTWMAIDQANGNLWFVFYDRRNYDDTRNDVYLALSTDGGNTFRNFKVSESPFAPNAGTFFGDYNGISAHNNKVRPIWTRLHQGKLSALTAIVDTVYSGLPPVDHAPFSVEETYPNPFDESTYFSFKVREPARVTLAVYDIFGRKVAGIIENEQMQPGKYTRQFDPAAFNLPSGVYYFTLNSKGQHKYRKIVFQKSSH